MPARAFITTVSGFGSYIFEMRLRSENRVQRFETGPAIGPKTDFMENATTSEFVVYI